MTLVLDRLGGFKRAGVAWLGSSRSPVELGRFAAALARAVVAAGIACDERPFHPHMTIARRCRVSPDEQPIGPYSWAIDGFELLQSETGREGARYRTLAKWPLTTEPEHARVLDLALGHRPLGIRAPLAPRAWVQARQRVARDVHRQHVVAGADAGTAVVDEVLRRAAVQHALEIGAQILRAAERSVGGDIARVGTVERAGDVAGDAVDRLDVAAIALGGARVEQYQRARARGSRRCRWR